MAVKLRSILRPIPWSLPLKSAVLGLALFFLPFWVFLIAAFYFYLFPSFQLTKLIWPFLAAVALASFWDQSWWVAALTAVIFFLILGIRELIFIERFPAYEILDYLLFFFLFFTFFSHFSFLQGWPAVWLLILAAVFYLLLKSLFDYEGDMFSSRRQKVLVLGLATLLIYELILVLLFLPLNVYYQTAVLFLFAVVLENFLADYLKSSLDRQKILVGFSVFFAWIAVILASARWGL